MIKAALVFTHISYQNKNLYRIFNAILILLNLICHKTLSGVTLQGKISCPRKKVYCVIQTDGVFKFSFGNKDPT